jgi:hypothetical protein
MYRIVFFTLLYIGKIIFVPAQAVKIDSLMKIQPEGIGKIHIDSNTAVYLKMPFSDYRFSDFSQLRFVKKIESIYGIDLVYTRYKELDSFNQPKLNYFRFKELKALKPEIFQQNNIVWRILEQREARTKNTAEKCFHGFVIHFKNDVPDSMAKSEIEIINKVLKSYSDTNIWIPEKIEWKIKRIKTETGFYLPNNDKKRKAGIRYKSRGLGFREPEYHITKDSTVRKKTGGYFQKRSYFDTSIFRNTREFRTLTKRKWSSGMAVVTDVTGSMTPYSAQILLWLKYQPDLVNTAKFTFFNDGNNTPDIYKKIGKTGGVYCVQNAVYDSIFATMTKAMSNGRGGDLPENDLEAVQQTLRQWPMTDTVLLIADNNAAVKDIVLLNSIKKPVSVMVCGSSNRVHADYIKIVNATGGKLFFLEHEVQNLGKLKNGNRIAIGSSIFEYQKGALVKVR